MKPTPALIITEVCLALGVDYGELIGYSRQPDVVTAREMIIVLCRELTHASFPEITRLIRPGGTGHSTAITAYRRAGQRMAGTSADPEFARRIDEIRSDIRSKTAEPAARAPGKVVVCTRRHAS